MDRIAEEEVEHSEYLDPHLNAIIDRWTYFAYYFCSNIFEMIYNFLKYGNFFLDVNNCNLSNWIQNLFDCFGWKDLLQYEIFFTFRLKQDTLITIRDSFTAIYSLQFSTRNYYAKYAETLAP